MNNEKYLFVAFIIFANVSKNRIIVHVHNALKLTNTTAFSCENAEMNID